MGYSVELVDTHKGWSGCRWRGRDVLVLNCYLPSTEENTDMHRSEIWKRESRDAPRQQKHILGT